MMLLRVSLLGSEVAGSVANSSGIAGRVISDVRPGQRPAILSATVAASAVRPRSEVAS